MKFRYKESRDGVTGLRFSVVTRLGNQYFLLEVTIQQTFKCFTVSSFVASHLVDGVVDSVETLCLCELCKLGLAEGSTVLSFKIGRAHV